LGAAVVVVVVGAAAPAAAVVVVVVTFAHFGHSGHFFKNALYIIQTPSNTTKRIVTPLIELELELSKS